MSLPLLCLLLAVAPPQPCDTAVVCPGEFREALRPWLAHRAAQGHVVRLLSNQGSAAVIRRQIRALADDGALKYVLLVGDADPAMTLDPALRARCVPTHLSRARVNVRWGSEPEIAADNWYADLDDDRVPDVALGRLPADSAAELGAMVEKTLRYERSLGFGPWRRRINLVAGLGGFGKVADAALEMTAKRLITDGIPADYCTTMTYASWQSPYCPDPRQFRGAVLDRLNEGCLFWVYIGHGQPRALDRVRTPLGQFPILADRDAPALQAQQGPAIACFLACYTAAYDFRDDCLAEALLRAPGGPVAAIGGSRVTMPYAMAVLSTELMDECFLRHADTLGGALLAAKRNMMAPAASPRRAGLDLIAKLISPAPADLAAERAEHLDLFQLMGDPLLRLRHPRRLKVDVARQVVAGEPLKLSLASPLAGDCTVELVARRDQLTFSPHPRGQFATTAAALAGWTAEYLQANNPLWAEHQQLARQGTVDVELLVPESARGAGHVRVFVAGADDFAAGAAEVEVVAPEKTPAGAAGANGAGATKKPSNSD